MDIYGQHVASVTGTSAPVAANAVQGAGGEHG